MSDDQLRGLLHAVLGSRHANPNPNPDPNPNPNPNQVSPVEKRSRIKEPPAVVRDGALAEKDDVYLGQG